MRTELNVVIAAAVIAVAPSATPDAFAGTRVFDPTLSTCTTANCSSERITGTTGALGGGGANPNSALSWTLEIFTPQQRCLRIQVTSQDRDLEGVLIAPNGTVFRNDDGRQPTCSLCPLIKVASTPNAGWSTLQVSRFNGDGLFANFSLLYGVYPVGNPNCTAPTTPQALGSAAAPASFKANSADSPDALGPPFDVDAAPPVD